MGEYDMEFFDKLFNTSGLGGLAVGFIVVSLVLSYSLTVRWISEAHTEKTETTRNEQL